MVLDVTTKVQAIIAMGYLLDKIPLCLKHIQIVFTTLFYSK